MATEPSELAPAEVNHQSQLAQQQERAAFLRAMPMFAETSTADILHLASFAQLRTYEPGDIVMAEGDHDPRPFFFVIRSGSVTITRSDDDGNVQLLGRATCGQYFGERSMLEGSDRCATVTANGPVPLVTYAFDHLAFERHIVSQVASFRQMRAGSRRELPDILHGIPTGKLGALGDLPHAVLDRLLEHATRTRHASNEVIFSEGDPGDSFHVLLEGSATVERDGRQVAWLGPGDFFGEMALLFFTPRTATVRTLRPSVILAVSGDAFDAAIGHHMLTREAIRDQILQRAASVVEAEAS